jgi:prepilin-type N-terminal cleavage/methylation domain-containing protein
LTLIELLAVVAIVGILAAVAVVSYRGYIVRARLQDAKVALETVRAEEEQYRAEFGHYCAHNTLVYFRGTQPPTAAPTSILVGDYRVHFTKEPAAGDDTYTARATPTTTRQEIGSSSKYGGWVEIDHDGTRDSEASDGTWP